MMNVKPFMALAIVAAVACNDNASPARSEDGLTGSASQPAAAPPEMLQMSKQAGIVGQSEGATDARDAAQSNTATPSDKAAAAGSAEISPSMLIRIGNASIEVDKLDPAIIKLRQLAAQVGGYVANASISGGRNQIRSATLELKIPAVRYDQAVTGLEGVGKVESVNTTVDDVGEEYVDLTARVTNSKRLEERLVNLLATRTGKLQDVLAVERELSRVREEIERHEGRLRYLRTRAAVSTLTVAVHEPFPILGQGPGQNPIVAALRQAWRNFVALISWLIASLGVLIPIGVIAAALWPLYRKLRGRRSL